MRNKLSLKETRGRESCIRPRASTVMGFPSGPTQTIKIKPVKQKRWILLRETTSVRKTESEEVRVDGKCRSNHVSHEPCAINLTMRIWSFSLGRPRSGCLYQEDQSLSEQIRRSISLNQYISERNRFLLESRLYCQRL